jgi:hypothetical protein
LEGLWVGLTVGMVSLALLLLALVFCIDWGKEVRKSLLRAKSIHTGDYVPFGMPISGSRGIGGFDFISNKLMETLEDNENKDYLLDQPIEENTL